MFEQVKSILQSRYNEEMSKYDNLKAQMDQMEEQFKNDNSENAYKDNIKFLNKRYSIFKRNSKEYKDELTQLQTEYNEKLKQFKADYDHYIELKNEAAKINVYVIQKKLEQLMNATSLEDLKISEEEATKIISGED